ncbi:MAG: hypothetical protein JXL97_02775 [Bacteroidales bacterium]|nr:hypothetical protein [Bacteroidales bacterium]
MTKKQSNLGYKITIILLSAVIAWLVYDKITTGKENNALIAEIEETSFQKDSLNSELSELYLTYNELYTNNESLNDSLGNQQQKIKELMEEISKVKSNDYARINQLKTEVETLKKIMKSYVRQIDSLYQENKILIAENTEIKHNYTQVVDINEQLTEQKDSLQETVNVAKELTAYNTSFVALNQRGKTTDRIKKAEKFQICFMMSENKVATTGRKNIYIRVTKPGSGEVLRNDNSGFFNFQGESIAYSSVRTLEYDGSAQDICLFYDINTEDLPEGDYTVFIFVDGRQIGDKTITLK